MDSNPITDGDDKTEAGEEVAGELVVARGDAAEVLEPAKGAFDNVAGLIGDRVEGMAINAGDLVGNDGDGAARSQQAAQVIGIIALVADKAAGRRRRRDQGASAGDVGDLTAGQEDGVRPAAGIDERVDLGRAPAAAAADRLVAFPPFAPEAER